MATPILAMPNMALRVVMSGGGRVWVYGGERIIVSTATADHIVYKKSMYLYVTASASTFHFSFD